MLGESSSPNQYGTECKTRTMFVRVLHSVLLLCQGIVAGNGNLVTTILPHTVPKAAMPVPGALAAIMAMVARAFTVIPV